jgi:hypothetical protein
MFAVTNNDYRTLPKCLKIQDIEFIYCVFLLRESRSAGRPGAWDRKVLIIN